MTYAQFLLVFLIPPIVGLALWQRKNLTRHTLNYIGFWALVAFLYTPIWDNYLVAEKVWWYEAGRVLFTIGYVPIEEYMFFILQPIMMGLWIHTLKHFIPSPPTQFVPNARIRWSVFAVLGGLWLWSVYTLWFGSDQSTYMGLILVWALPPIMFQWGFGGDILWHHRRLMLASIVTGTAYLASADAYAIYHEIWTINPAKSYPLLLGGVLPIEEFVFFLVTNILISLATVFVIAPESYVRANIILQRLVGNGWQLAPPS